MAPSISPATAIAERTYARVNRRLMPYLVLLYIVAYLDRVNVSYAGLQMTRELGFSNSVFGLGGGIFFIGYFLLEIPGAVLAEVWSARKWIARILLTWGVLASATGLIHSVHQFYAIRFLLGLAEAGFLPGLFVYISHWYVPRDRGKAMAMLMAGAPASLIIGGPLSAIFLKIHWLGFNGWRWLMLLEGIPALILGVVTLFYLTDHPRDAKWLAADERAWLTGELEQERAARASHMSAWKSLRDPRVLLLAFTLFLGLTATYGIGLWMPKIIERLSAFGVSRVSLIAAVPYLFALPAMLYIGWHSDRTGERKWHAAIPRIVGGAALAVCVVSSENAWISLVALSVAAAGFYGSHGGFWPIPTMFLGRTAAAASIGLINSFGNLGGFLGPYAIGFLTDKTGGFGASLVFLSACSLASGLLILRMRLARE
jgi:MFS transporter, ACS family, tartrate transporter